MAGAGLFMATTLNMVELKILCTGKSRVVGRTIIELALDVKNKMQARAL